MSVRRNIIPGLAAVVLALSLTACGGGDEAEQTDGGAGTSTTTETMDPGMDHSKMDNPGGMNH